MLPLLSKVVVLYTVPLLNNEEVIHTCTVVMNHTLRSTDGILYHEFRSKTLCPVEDVNFIHIKCQAICFSFST